MCIDSGACLTVDFSPLCCSHWAALYVSQVMFEDGRLKFEIYSNSINLKLNLDRHQKNEYNLHHSVISFDVDGFTNSAAVSTVMLVSQSSFQEIHGHS